MKTNKIRIAISWGFIVITSFLAIIFLIALIGNAIPLTLWNFIVPVSNTIFGALNGKYIADAYRHQGAEHLREFGVEAESKFRV